LVSHLLQLRKDGTISEDEIAQELGFRTEMGLGPAGRMHTRLENLQLPEWVVYPDATKAESRNRKVRTFGRA
jgi:hypothetical protein